MDNTREVASYCRMCSGSCGTIVTLDEQDRVKLSRKQALRELNKAPAGAGESA